MKREMRERSVDKGLRACVCLLEGGCYVFKKLFAFVRSFFCLL